MSLSRFSPSLPPSLSQLRSVWLTAGPHCIRLNHKLPTHPPPYLHPPLPPYLTLPSPSPLPISISLSLSSPIFHSPCISPAPPLLFLPSSNHYSLLFAPLISLALPVHYNMNAFLLRGLPKRVWTAGHVGECLLVWCAVWPYSVSLSGGVAVWYRPSLHLMSVFSQFAIKTPGVKRCRLKSNSVSNALNGVFFCFNRNANMSC